MVDRKLRTLVKRRSHGSGIKPEHLMPKTLYHEQFGKSQYYNKNIIYKRKCDLMGESTRKQPANLVIWGIGLLPPLLIGALSSLSLPNEALAQLRMSWQTFSISQEQLPGS